MSRYYLISNYDEDPVRTDSLELFMPLLVNQTYSVFDAQENAAAAKRNLLNSYVGK